MGIEARQSFLCVLLFFSLDLTRAKPDTSNILKLPRNPNHYHTENDNQYWLDGGMAVLQERLDFVPKLGKAKNVIMFLGDGMSVPTVTAARIYAGQLQQKTGESSSLSWEHFPYTGLAKTYCVDKQVPDSACTATAYLNGVKNNMGTIGVNAKIKKKDCIGSKDKNNHTSSILKWAQEKNKATGVLTTTRVTHASPAGNYAHTADRDWESDYDIKKDSQANDHTCKDIAHQLVTENPGQNIRVILGGGRKKFLPNTTVDPEGQGQGQRTDGLNLIEIWEKNKRQMDKNPKFVYDRQGLNSVNIAETDYLLGLFEADHMKYHLEANETTEPTLEEMTEVAIKLLSKESNGFFLFIEGGKIDMAHHENWAHMALDETNEMSKAVAKAVSMTEESETLIVVTADHAHTMTMNGYPNRGTDILDATEKSDIDNELYPTLSYANGPGYRKPELKDNTCAHFDLRNDPPTRKNVTYRYPVTVAMTEETHGGDDVAIYSRGPWSHLFTGVHEQNIIPLIMAYSSKIGPYESLNPSAASASPLYLNSNFWIPNLGLVLTSLYYCIFR